MAIPMLSSFTPLGGSLYLGWTLGANNAANVFGTAVATRILSYRNACFLCCIALIAGAILQGTAGIETLRNLTGQTMATAMIVTICAALTGTAMTYLRIPISTSQAVVGAILGIGLVKGNADYSGLTKIVACWIGTPIGSMIIAMIVYKLLGIIIDKVPMSMLTRDKILWSGLIIVGTYGSYALGANNVTNAVGVFAGLFEGLSNTHLAMIGSLAIAVGVITYSKPVMMAVGSGIMPLDAFTAFVAVFSMAATVHVFAIIGAPVSTSQGIVGAIIGIGIIKGNRAVKISKLKNIVIGWAMTPVIALVLASSAYAIFVK